jgi:phosphoglucomutase
MQTVQISNPYSVKKMGTSGLRLVQEEYNKDGFLEQFIQGIASYFFEISDNDTFAEKKKTILLGGDPRKGNKERIKKTAAILAGNGFEVIIAGDGLASTPAMSHGIRFLKVLGGIIFTASHNPFTDVGIKINTSNGAPALDDTVNRVFELQNSTSEYKITDFDKAKTTGVITHVDIIKMYADLLDSVFNFSSMKEKNQNRNIKAAFDAMNGAAGPFAREVFINRLDLDAKILREEPREDLGGYDEHGHPMHPEPDFAYIPDLIKENSTGNFDIVAAWDSDVDRRLDGGSGFFVESADEFALFARFSELIKIDSLFDNPIFFCRSTVTAGPADLMEKELEEKFSGKNVKSVETPTGFKWIAELGNWGVEESNGVGNPYLREKDGIFSTVFLLKIILETGKKPQELLEEIWNDYGRIYFTRGEVSGTDSSEKTKLEDILRTASSRRGEKCADLTLENAESWNYIHPVTNDIAAKDAAFVLSFSDGNTVKARFSGTGSGGYTLRVYCYKYDKKFNRAKSSMMQPMKDAFDAFLKQGGFNGKSEKYTDTHQPEMYT